MTRLLSIGKLLMMAGVTFLLVAAGLAFIEVRGVAKDSRETVKTANAAIGELKARVEELKGSIQDMNAALLQIGLTGDEARRAAIEETQSLTAQNKAFTKTIESANEFIAHGTAILDGLGQDAHGSIGRANAALDEVPPLLRNLQTVTETVNRQAANPDIPRALAGLADASQQTSATMVQITGVATNVNAMSLDVRTKVHKELNPSKLSIAGGLLWTGVKLVATRMVP